MVKSAMIRARVEPALKEAAERILTELGLNSTQAITLFYREVVRQRGLPFELRLPPASQQETPGSRSGP
jgi:DNA-damage-inducible protein J